MRVRRKDADEIESFVSNKVREVLDPFIQTKMDHTTIPTIRQAIETIIKDTDRMFNLSGIDYSKIGVYGSPDVPGSICFNMYTTELFERLGEIEL